MTLGKNTQMRGNNADDDLDEDARAHGGNGAGACCHWARAPALARTNYAVLVAVTKYPNLPREDLAGRTQSRRRPGARLSADERAGGLSPRRTSRVLADGVEGATGNADPCADPRDAEGRGGQGRRRAISSICIFPAMARRSRSARPATRPTAWTRSSCPPTSSKWVDRTKGVPNALVDDDIGAALDAIRNKGAFVWIVFDACHSGSATRAAPVDEDLEVSRKLDFDDLGIPARRGRRSRGGAVRRARATRAKPPSR